MSLRRTGRPGRELVIDLSRVATFIERAWPGAEFTRAARFIGRDMDATVIKVLSRR